MTYVKAVRHVGMYNNGRSGGLLYVLLYVLAAPLTEFTYRYAFTWINHFNHSIQSVLADAPHNEHIASRVVARNITIFLANRNTSYNIQDLTARKCK